MIERVLDPDGPGAFSGAPLWGVGAPVHERLCLDERPWELGNAFQAAIDAGEQIAAVEIGATRDLTAPARRPRGELSLPEPPMSDAYDFFQQGRSHLKGGMAAQATVALEKAKKLEPDKASIREALGIAYFRIQRWREAEAEFRAVLELSPADDYAHYALGRALEKQGRDAEANGHYKLASSLSPNSEHYAERIMELDRPEGEDQAD